ncbi:SIS domain-containing protein [Rathayibacter sp. ZW T2_19]|uniref:SIS domain-containing protein n=1 Tax=Rathayibacter rubneri TaxID=2950106 RepID=A0A9X2DU45_9MICO|nr:SIS domain-containing protein [Rathayibacter rubneri]MCM6761237.1 SIS domain-containing protein [Rathayibacter rubneri]
MTEAISSVIEAARVLVQAESDAVRSIADQIDENLVLTASAIGDSVGRVIVTGVGTSGFIARRAAHLFSVTGTPAFFLHPTEALHGSLGAVSADDVVIALSKGGSSAEVNDLVDRARTIGATVVALTSAPTSVLAEVADITVVLRTPDEADPGAVIAMGSTLAYGAWLDALALVLMRTRQYSWESVRFSHPGGAVGQCDSLPAPVPPLALP